MVKLQELSIAELFDSAESSVLPRGSQSLFHQGFELLFRLASIFPF